MHLLRCRVVRGPDWKWNDQDGGEGGVGTIVSTDTFSEGKPLNQQTVLVQWDNGRQADYRLGKDGNYDLRILDSAPSGAFFNDVMCGGCEQTPLLGTRWSCADCDEYDLCTNCYNNDMHDVDHNFMRCDHYNLQSIDVGKRSSSVKIQAKGIFPGSEVTSISGYDLGNMIGSVIMDHRMSNDIPVGKVLVGWGDEPSTKIEHNVGYDGEVHLKLKTPVPGIYYYKDHLMIPSIALDTDKKFQVKDKVTVHLDLNDLHQIMTSYDHWEPEMERAISEVGVVEKVDGTGISVKFKTLENALVFPPYVFSKVHDLRVKDKVAVSDNKEKVIMLQNGHGGWDTNMEKCLGKKGVVLKIDKDNDALVEVGEDTWLFNPAALILESKEEERVSPDTVMTDSVGEFFDEFLKAIKDEDVMSKVAEGYMSLLKNMPPITVVVNEGKDHKEVLKKLLDDSDDDTVNGKDESLTGQACAAPQSTAQRKNSDEDKDEDESVFVRPTKMDDIPLNRRPDRTESVYKMTSYPRGVAFIVNVEHFNVDPGHSLYGKHRVGSKKDVENVIRLFQNLGFIDVTISRTQSAKELLKELKKISTQYDYSETDCFVLFVMSHGEEDCIYTSDGIKVPTSWIVSCFWKSRCKSLAGKPKLFFFQACRGVDKDRGACRSDAPDDALYAADDDSTPSTLELDHVDEVAETADILEFFSSYVGFTSYRYTETGSPFIRIIVEVFRKEACRHHILELITEVKKRVSKDRHSGEKQMPHHNDTLTRYLYFWPGIDF